MPLYFRNGMHDQASLKLCTKQSVMLLDGVNCISYFKFIIVIINTLVCRAQSCTVYRTLLFF